MSTVSDQLEHQKLAPMYEAMQLAACMKSQRMGPHLHMLHACMYMRRLPVMLILKRKPCASCPCFTAQAMTSFYDHESLAEEWHNLLCMLDPTHPEYVSTPIAEQLDPYTLAYTILLLKEGLFGRLPQPAQHALAQLKVRVHTGSTRAAVRCTF